MKSYFIVYTDTDINVNMSVVVYLSHMTYWLHMHDFIALPKKRKTKHRGPLFCRPTIQAFRGLDVVWAVLKTHQIGNQAQFGPQIGNYVQSGPLILYPENGHICGFRGICNPRCT